VADPVLYTSTATTDGAGLLTGGSPTPFKSVVFSKLTGEDTLLFTYHFRHSWTASSTLTGGWISPRLTGLYANIYTATGSQGTYAKSPHASTSAGTGSGMFNVWKPYATSIQIVSASFGTGNASNYRSTNPGGALDIIGYGPLAKRLPWNSVSGSTVGVKIEFFFKHTVYEAYNASSILSTQFLEVSLGRSIGTNLGRESLGVVSFASIGAPPTSTTTDPNEAIGGNAGDFGDLPPI
jgi:hypothetical protein